MLRRAFFLLSLALMLGGNPVVAGVAPPVEERSGRVDRLDTETITIAGRTFRLAEFIAVVDQQGRSVEASSLRPGQQVTVQITDDVVFEIMIGASSAGGGAR